MQRRSLDSEVRDHYGSYIMVDAEGVTEVSFRAMLASPLEAESTVVSGEGTYVVTLLPVGGAHASEGQSPRRDLAVDVYLDSALVRACFWDTAAGRWSTRVRIDEDTIAEITYLPASGRQQSAPPRELLLVRASPSTM